jgi:hypothetical protein
MFKIEHEIQDHLFEWNVKKLRWASPEKINKLDFAWFEVGFVTDTNQNLICPCSPDLIN